MQAVHIGTNKAGCKFAVMRTRSDDYGYGVWRECENYAAHVRGGIAKTWRYCEKEMTLEAARELFERKVNGYQRA